MSIWIVPWVGTQPDGLSTLPSAFAFGSGVVQEEVHGKCEWLHPPLCELPALRTAWVQERRKERAVASQLSGDVHPPSDKRFKTARAKVRLNCTLC